MATSTEILDATNDEGIRRRLNAVRPTHVTDQMIWDNMALIVRADLDGAGASIATVLRYAIGQAGKDAGARAEFVTDTHLTKALDLTFPEPTA